MATVTNTVSTPDLFGIAVAILNGRPLTEELLEEILKMVSQFHRIDGDGLGELRKRLESQIGVMGVAGVGLTAKSDPDPWLDQRKSEQKNWDYWNAYKHSLRNSGFSSDVIRVLDDDTDAILGECGDPKSEGPWSIKGLVMGDVQSGSRSC